MKLELDSATRLKLKHLTSLDLYQFNNLGSSNLSSTSSSQMKGATPELQ